MNFAVMSLVFVIVRELLLILLESNRATSISGPLCFLTGPFHSLKVGPLSYIALAPPRPAFLT